MHKQIGDYEYRIALFLTDTDIYNRTVSLCHYTVKCHRSCHPLIFLNSAIIMCIQISQSFTLIKWILLYVDTR